ncbi:MAG: DUF2933 domain-containing protein [Spirochaetota bacterium]
MSREFVRAGEWFRRRSVPIGICVFFVGAGLYISFQYGSHLVGVVPYLFLLACPLMHLFMHQGHGGLGSHGHDADAGNSTGLRRTYRGDSGERPQRHPH